MPTQMPAGGEVNHTPDGINKVVCHIPSTLNNTVEASNGRGFGFANISPNPSSESVRIQYFLEKTADVRLDVVNVLGQKVASLFSGKQAAGEHEAAWNGLASNGLRAQAGVYFVRLAVGDEVVVERVVWR